MPLAKPPLVWPQSKVRILNGQVGWWVAPHRRNIMPLNTADLTLKTLSASLGATFTIGSFRFGSCFKGTGASTSFMDLGATNIFIKQGKPYTMLWVEAADAGIARFQGLATLWSGSTNECIFFRCTDNNIGPANFGGFTAGFRSSGLPRAVSFPCPPLANSNGATSIFVLTCISAGSNTPTDYALNVGGTDYAPQQGGTISAATAPLNYFGADNGDQCWSGLLDNLRIWNRVLTRSEILSLVYDPYLGGRPRRLEYLWGATSTAASGASSQRWFLMQ